MRTTVFLFIFFSISIACREAKKSSVDLLFDQVMKEHDDAMALMTDIYTYTKQLADTTLSVSDLNQVKQYQSDLSQAEEAMMDWMAQFKKPNSQDEQVITDYLNQQYKSISDIHQQMIRAINQAKSYATNN